MEGQRLESTIIDSHLVPFGDAAEFIGHGMSTYMIRKLVRTGDLKRVTIGDRKHFITKASIDAYIARLIAA